MTPVPRIVINHTNRRDRHTDDTVDGRRRVRDEGSDDERDDDAAQRDRREIIRHHSLLVRLHRLPVFMEEKNHHRHRHQRTELHRPENTRTPVHPEELHEVHVRIVTEHDGGRIPDEGRGTLQIRRHGDRQNHRYRRDIQLLTYRERHRCNHEHRSDIIDKCRHRAGEQGHQDDDPHDIRALIKDDVRQQIRHLRLDEKPDDEHRAADHHEDIPVDDRQDVQRIRPENPDQHEGDRDAPDRIDLPVRLRNHNHIHKNKQDECNRS